MTGGFWNGVVSACATWHFERHTEVNLHDRDVLHSWSLLVDLHKGHAFKNRSCAADALCVCCWNITDMCSEK